MNLLIDGVTDSAHTACEQDPLERGENMTTAGKMTSQGVRDLNDYGPKKRSAPGADGAPGEPAEVKEGATEAEAKDEQGEPELVSSPPQG